MLGSHAFQLSRRSLSRPLQRAPRRFQDLVSYQFDHSRCRTNCAGRPRYSFAMRHVIERRFSSGCSSMYSRISAMLLPVDLRHCSNSPLALTLASPSAICTRLWALTSPRRSFDGQEDMSLNC